MRRLLPRFGLAAAFVAALGVVATRGVRAQSAGGSIAGVVTPASANGAVVYLEGVPAAAWRAPTDVPAITQHGAAFHPEFLVVVVGQTVSFPNDDRLTHNVFSVSAPRRFDLGHYHQGETRTVLFDQPGVVDLFCNIHDNMHATIVVVPSPYFAIPDATGHFAISNVPPGSYRLVAYSTVAGSASATVAVTLHATTTVNLTFARR